MSQETTMPNLAIRAKPKPVKRFSRKILLLGAGSLGLGLFAALAFALQSPNDKERPDELYNVSHKPMAGALDALPKTYADIKPAPVSKPVLGPPLPGDLGGAFLEGQGQHPVKNKDNPFRYAPGGVLHQPYNQTVTTRPAPAPSKRTEARESGLFFSVASTQRRQNGAPQSYPSQYAQMDMQALQGTAGLNALTGMGLSMQGLSLSNQAGFVPPPKDQSGKAAFLAKPAGEIYNPYVLQSPKSPYQIMAGTLIPASLVTGLNSDLPGQVIGQVTENVYDTVTGQYLLIPQGARLLGRYDSVIAYGQSRALVAWTRIIFPNGNSIQLDNLPAVDGQGFAGLKDKVDRHTWQFMKGAVLSSLLSVSAELASDDSSRLARALQNAGQDTANIAGQRIIERSLNIQPTLSVRPGWRVSIIVSKDLILKPYK